MQTKYKRVLIKLSGEALAGEKGFGLDEPTLESIAKTIKECVALGVQIAVVVGGGNFWRGRTGEIWSARVRTHGNACNGDKLARFV